MNERCPDCNALSGRQPYYPDLARAREKSLENFAFGPGLETSRGLASRVKNCVLTNGNWMRVGVESDAAGSFDHLWTLDRSVGYFGRAGPCRTAW
jgi:hypothetical protein